MKHFFRNIRTKLILAFAFMLIIPAAIIGAISNTTARDTLEHHVLNGISENINLLNLSIDDVIKPKIHDIETLSSLFSANSYNGESSPDIRKITNPYIQLHPEAQAIFVGTKDGVFVREPKKTMPEDYDPRTRDWYFDAMEKKGETVISPPYVSASTGDIVVTISKTTNDGTGVVGVDIELSRLLELNNQVMIGEEGYALILDQNRGYIAHPTKEAGVKAKEKFFDKMYDADKGLFSYELNGEHKMMRFVTNEVTGWKIAGSLPSSEFTAAAKPIIEKTVLVIILSTIIGGLMTWLIIKSILKPIRILREKAITVSQGDLTEQIEINSTDEIGQLGLAFYDMQVSLRFLVHEVAQLAQQVSASAEELTASSEQTTIATEQVAASIQEVASGAEKQTDGVEKSVHFLAEVTNNASLITGYSKKVSELAQVTTEQAEIGGHAVTNTVEQMNSIHKSVVDSNTIIKSLSERSKEVSTILSVITGIADQTNLLALNAAIEAARAGEHGRGFAVVADEVRKLAEQSQTSAQKIHEIIKGIQTDTESSVQIMALVTDDVQAGVEISREAIEKFNQIHQSTKEIVPQMKEILITAHQMADVIREVTSNTNDSSIIAQENAATAEEVAASTEEQLASMEEISASANSLSTMAEELIELISKFKY